MALQFKGPPQQQPAAQVQSGATLKFKGAPAPAAAPAQPPVDWSAVPGQALYNTPSSAYNFGADIVHAVTHPIQTADGMLDLAAGGISRGIEYATGNEDLFPENKATQTADAVGNFYADRYGSLDGFGRSVATDPVGVLSDLSLPLTGGGSALVKGAQVASKVPRLTKAASVASKIGNTAKTLGEFADPISTGAKLAVHGAGNIGKVYTALTPTNEARALTQLYEVGDKVYGPNNAMGASRAIHNLGPEAVYGDVLGEEGYSAARAAANINPTARERLKTFANERQGDQNVRLTRDVQEAGGVPVGSRKSVEDLQKEHNAKLQPDIDAAYAEMRDAGVDISLGEFKDIFGTPMGKTAKKEAIASLRNRNFDQAPLAEAVASGPPPAKTVDPRNVGNRAVKQLSPSLGPRPRRPTSLVDFIKDKGGVSDFKGEMKSLNAETIRGLVREGGISLDQARELAAREGYLDHRFGNSDAAVSESSVADFLDAIDQNVRGDHVFSSADTFEADKWRNYKDAQASRAEIWEAGKRVGEEFDGRTVNKDALGNAVSRVVERGDHPGVALDEALYDDFLNYGAEPQEVPYGIFENDGRNFSNAALLDEVKRSLDDIGSSAKRKGRNNRAGVATNMAKTLRERMDGLMEGNEYSKARDMRKSAYDAERAYTLGEELAQPNPAINLPEAAGKVDPKHKPNVAAAYAQTKAQSLMNNNDTAAALKGFETDMAREAYKAALDEKGAAKLGSAVQREATYRRLLNEVSGGSTTARQWLDANKAGAGSTALAVLAGLEPVTAMTVGGLVYGGKKAYDVLRHKNISKRQVEGAKTIAEHLTSKELPPPVPKRRVGRAETLAQGIGPVGKPLPGAASNVAKAILAQQMLDPNSMAAQFGGPK